MYSQWTCRETSLLGTMGCSFAPVDFSWEPNRCNESGTLCPPHQTQTPPESQTGHGNLRNLSVCVLVNAIHTYLQHIIIAFWPKRNTKPTKNPKTQTAKRRETGSGLILLPLKWTGVLLCASKQFGPYYHTGVSLPSLQLLKISVRDSRSVWLGRGNKTGQMKREGEGIKTSQESFQGYQLNISLQLILKIGVWPTRCVNIK